MLCLRLLTFVLFCVALLCPNASAQSEKVRGTTPASAPSVSVSLTGKGLRFVALGPVRKVRLEVMGADGSPVSDSGFRPGSVYDWARGGAATPDSTYQFVLTVMDVSGRLSLKQCAVAITGGEAALQLGEAEGAGDVDSESATAVVKEAETNAITFNAHDGRDGEVVSTIGGGAFNTASGSNAVTLRP